MDKNTRRQRGMIESRREEKIIHKINDDGDDDDDNDDGDDDNEVEWRWR